MMTDAQSKVRFEGAEKEMSFPGDSDDKSVPGWEGVSQWFPGEPFEASTVRIRKPQRLAHLPPLSK